MFVFIIIGIFLAVIVTGWILMLHIQRERKISELKVAYIRMASEEESAYQSYFEAEKRQQEFEMSIEKSSNNITDIKLKLIDRRKELREFIANLRDVKTRLESTDTTVSKLDIELQQNKLNGEIKTRLTLNNEDKKKIIAERRRIAERKEMFPSLIDETEELGRKWESLRKEIDRVEREFRELDEKKFKRFSEAFIKKRKEEKALDPERELVNLLLLLNNKQGLLYVRKKEAAKDPTTESTQLVEKYESDVRKLEAQLKKKAKSFGITPERLNELKGLFLK